jgi:predicted phosphoribosyltransferase
VRREQRYRGGRPPLDLAGRVLILVTTASRPVQPCALAVQAARAGDPKQVIVAVPVASTEAVQSLSALADEVVCLFTPKHFRAVGLWYQDFTQTRTKRWTGCWREAARRRRGRAGAAPRRRRTLLRECPPPFGLLLYFAAQSTPSA